MTVLTFHGHVALQSDIEAEMEKEMEKDPKGFKTLPTIFDFYTEVRHLLLPSPVCYQLHV